MRRKRRKEVDMIGHDDVAPHENLPLRSLLGEGHERFMDFVVGQNRAPLLGANGKVIYRAVGEELVEPSQTRFERFGHLALL